MVVLSTELDKRINSYNLYAETTFGEYLEFANDIIKNNDFQRKRVNASKTIYSLLKSDLKKGCVIPPLVLAITDNNKIDVNNSEELSQSIENVIKNTPQNVLILDGLQRTYTLIDAYNEILEEYKGTPEKISEFREFKVRLEIYVNINKFGVLYRMLTLNTGQTPMSVRHQLEILYHDKLDTDFEGIRLITEVQGTANPNKDEFIFKNVIEGFNSFMNRSELPVDRQDLLDNVEMLENLSSENIKNDLFEDFLALYTKFFKKLRDKNGDYALTEEDRQNYEISNTPFGKNVSKVFSSSQAMTGFGAALGKMKDLEVIKDFYDIEESISQISDDKSDIKWFLELLKRFDDIKTNSKKIGNAQRMFMHYFFRELFNKDSDSYLNLMESVKNGYKKYCSQV
jgi:hypothetical protein